eukprot:5101719-Ditylum_brightwellii.AAC.1
MDSTYLHLWDLLLQTSHGWEARIPSSKQILGDSQCIPSYSIFKQIKARGVVVHGCRTCRCHRANGAYQVGNWGGPRERKSFSARFIHPDAASVVEERIKQSALIGKEMSKSW